MSETLSVIGCGAVATPLVRSLVSTGNVSLGRVWNGSAESSEQAVARLGAGVACAGADELEPADLVLIGAPDRRIVSIARQISSTPVAGRGSVVFHLSGALPAESLSALRQNGAALASLHPIVSVPSLAHAPHDLSGTYCALEGDEEGCTRLETLAGAAGLRPFRIRGDRKALYHAGAVFATNYFIALEEAAVSLYEDAGVSRETALEFLHPFVRGALDNFRVSSRGAALSGPIARGDVETVECHLTALQQGSRMLELYRLLGREALELVRSRGGWKSEHDVLSVLLGAAVAEPAE